MKVTLTDEGLNIEGLEPEQTELILDSLIRFANITLKEKASDAATTEDEKIKLKADRKMAHVIYKAIEVEHSKVTQL